jgi:hypothetical protein
VVILRGGAMARRHAARWGRKAAMAVKPYARQKRRYYRLQYPESERPLLSFSGGVYKAIDISEGGVRFSLTTRSAAKLVTNMVIAGTIDFCGRGTFPIKGRLLRIMEDLAVIELDANLPLFHIMAEQRYLIQKYKNEL